MLLPNISSLFKWINPFYPGVKNGSSDFLQLSRASDGTILGWIDETGTPRGSLALASGGGGVRVLKGSAEYLINNGAYADLDPTNLSTTITVPVGYALVVVAYGVANFTGAGGSLGIAVDNSVLNSTTSQLSNLVPFSVASSFAGDGNSHVIALQGDGGLEVLSPVMTLVLAPSI
jgi:hypothetical protein